MKRRISARLPKEFKTLAGVSPPFKQRLYFVGILTKYLKPEGIEPIVVGGHALEFHTLGSYATGDIDLVAPGHSVIDRLLRSWGFEKVGRHWLYSELDLEVEMPGSFPDDIDRARVTRVKVKGLEVTIIGVEDLIVDRLNAYVHWKSSRDGEWVQQLLALHRNRIDWAYLERRAGEEKTIAALCGLKRKD